MTSFFSFLLTFLQSMQRNNRAVQKAVNSGVGNLGWGSRMVKAWREPEEIHRLARRLLFADTIEGTGSERCVDACHLLPPFPPPDRTSMAETAAQCAEVEAWGKTLLHPWVPSPLSRLCCSWSWTGVGIVVVSCTHVLTELCSCGGSKLIFFCFVYT